MEQKRTTSSPVPILLAGLLAAIASALVTLLIVSTVNRGGGGEPQQGGPPGGGPPATPVRVGAIQVQSLQDRFPIIGRLRELQRAIVASEVSGKVLRVDAEEGDTVVGGQTVLLEIEGVWVNIALESAEAQIAAQRAQLDQSQRDLEQLEVLAEQKTAKPKEVADARARVESDRALLNAAIAIANRAREQVQRLKILAPFDGVVVRKMAEVGQWVEEGTDVMEVVSQGRIDALIDVPERLVNLIGVGDTILVVIDALRLEAEGQIVSINPSGMSAARTFPVKVRLDDRGGLLKPGMSVTAMLPIGEQGERLTVPRDAVLYRGGAASVWVTTPSDEQTSLAAPIPVRALFGVGDRVAIEPVIASDASRLAEGTPVVVEGAERLSPGTPVTFGEGPATAENGGPPEQPEPTTGG